MQVYRVRYLPTKGKRMSTLSMVAAAAALTLILPAGTAQGIQLDVTNTDFRNVECFYVDTPLDEAATMCLQLDSAHNQGPRWALRNDTDWVLDLVSPAAWNDTIAVKFLPSRTDLSSYFTRLWLDSQAGDALAVQPGEIVFMPASLSIDGSVYEFPEGTLSFNAEGTAAMVAMTSAIASADLVATDRAKLYRIVKRAKACASAGAEALLATDQTIEAYDAVLTNLTAYKACDKYLRGVAKQAKAKVPSSWRVVARDLGDNFFIQARTAVIKLIQFSPRA